MLNGKEHAATVTFHRIGSTARYTLRFADLPDVRLDATLSVKGSVLTFRTNQGRRHPDSRVHTIEIPDQDLISASSNDRGAQTSFTQVDVDSTRDADQHARVSAETEAEKAPTGASYAILNTDRLAASIEYNSTYDDPSGATEMDRGRFWHQARSAQDGSKRVGVSNGQWTYRGEGAARTSQPPGPRSFSAVTPTKTRRSTGRMAPSPSAGSAWCPKAPTRCRIA